MRDKIMGGFTLIELLIVIAIIGILASIVLVSISLGKQRAIVASYKSTVTSLNKALLVCCDNPTTINPYVGDGATDVCTTAINSLWPDSATLFVAANTDVDIIDDCDADGAFTVTIDPVNLPVTACTDDVTTLEETGVTFPAGC